MFFKPGIGPVGIKLSDANKEFLSNWLPTDDIRFYEILDPAYPKHEHGFYNPRLDKRFPI